MKEQILKKEAALIFKFLFGAKIPVVLVDRYLLAVKTKQLSNSTLDQKLFDFLFRFPFLFPAIDGGLALKKKDAVLRKKVLLVSAIGETFPDLNHAHLPQEFSFLYWIKVFYVGARAAMWGIVGYFLLMILGGEGV